MYSFEMNNHVSTGISKKVVIAIFYPVPRKLGIVELHFNISNESTGTEVIFLAESLVFDQSAFNLSLP